MFWYTARAPLLLKKAGDESPRARRAKNKVLRRVATLAARAAAAAAAAAPAPNEEGTGASIGVTSPALPAQGPCVETEATAGASLAGTIQKRYRALVQVRIDGRLGLQAGRGGEAGSLGRAQVGVAESFLALKIILI